jgi:hypothetical protein
MIYFQTKNPNLAKLRRVLQCKILVYFVVIWYILLPFGIFLIIWCILPVLVCCTKKNLATLDAVKKCAAKKVKSIGSEECKPSAKSVRTIV